MIQSCPSCGTLYREAAPMQGAKGRCSGCREVFPLAALKPYRLVAVAASREVPVAVGAATAGSRRSAVERDDPFGAANRPGAYHGHPAAPRHDAGGHPETAFVRPPAGAGVGSSIRGGSAASPGADGPAAFDSMLEDIRPEPALSWLGIAGWTLAGFGTGVAAQLVLGGPVWVSAGAGAAAAWLAAWGHQRWILRRS